MPTTMVQTATDRVMPPPLPPRRRRATVAKLHDGEEEKKVERKPLVEAGGSAGSEESLLYVLWVTTSFISEPKLSVAMYAVAHALVRGIRSRVVGIARG